MRVVNRHTLAVFRRFSTRYNAENKLIIDTNAIRFSSNSVTKLVTFLPDIQPDNLHMISGDASFRRYFRFNHAGQSFIGVDSPPETEKNHEFVALSSEYIQQSVPVPKVIHSNYDIGFMMLEDFGNVLFSDKLQGNENASWYQKALSHLPNIQSVQSTDNQALPAFNRTLLDAEFHLFNHWLLDVHLELKLKDSEWQIILDTQRYLSEVMLAQPQVGVHRDYHSRNLMIMDDGGIGIIDFQDAVIGPLTYDAVSLLRDCYVVWPDEFVEQQLKAWQSEHFSQYDWNTFKHWFDCTGMQRHIKASGIFARLCHRDGKAGYLDDIPRTLEYLVSVGGGISQCASFAALVANKILPAVLNKASEAKRP